MFRPTTPWLVLPLLVCLAVCSAPVAAGERSTDSGAARTAKTYRTAKRARQYGSASHRAVSSSEAQALVDAPIARNYLPRNYGPTDVGGKGTAVGNGIPQVAAEPTTLTTFYGGYGAYAWPWRPGPRFGYPSYGYPFFGPQIYYGNWRYGGYGAPFYSGFARFSYPYNYGALGYGYPSYGCLRPTYAYPANAAYALYPGVGGLYVPPGYFGFPGHYGYGGYGIPPGNFGYGGAFYW